MEVFVVFVGLLVVVVVMYMYIVCIARMWTWIVVWLGGDGFMPTSLTPNPPPPK